MRLVFSGPISETLYVYSFAAAERVAGCEDEPGSWLEQNDGRKYRCLYGRVYTLGGSRRNKKKGVTGSGVVVPFGSNEDYRFHGPSLKNIAGVMNPRPCDPVQIKKEPAIDSRRNV